jgi:hypothetical protein
MPKVAWPEIIASLKYLNLKHMAGKGFTTAVMPGLGPGIHVF